MKMKSSFQNMLGNTNIWFIIAGMLVAIAAMIATTVEHEQAGYENINRNCPDGKVVVEVPSDTSSAKIKKIAGEMFIKNKGCRITIKVVPMAGFTENKKPSEQVMGTTVVISCDDPNDCPAGYACAIGAQVCVPHPEFLP